MHKGTRSLLTQFVCKGLPQEQVKELLSLIQKHAPSLLECLAHLTVDGMKGSLSQCPVAWADFIGALASSSSVCALVHPSSKLLQTLLHLDSSKYASSIEGLQYLQQEIPVLFNLLRILKSFPTYLTPIIHEMARKAEAPFQASAASCISPPCNTNDVSYFPNLPTVRSHESYEADRVVQAKICTKRALGHPTLLPGLFTLFCKHGAYLVLWPLFLDDVPFHIPHSQSGVCYGFEVMRVSESPNTAFTLLYSRFQHGTYIVLISVVCIIMRMYEIVYPRILCVC